MNQIRKILMIMKIKKINNNLDIDNKIIDIKFITINYFFLKSFCGYKIYKAFNNITNFFI